MSRVRASLACGALIAVVLAGCNGHGASRSRTGGTLVIAAEADADNLFPPLTITSQGRQVTDQLFDYLADIGPGLNTIGDRGFTPRLADRWTWAPDSLSIAFHVNPRARWHDGAPVTARDVRFTYDLVRDTTVGSPVAAVLANVDSVTVRDPGTAVVWFKRRTPEEFADVAYNLAILPEHLLASVPRRSLASSRFAHHPVGSGRFRFERWDAGSRIVLTADPGNYRGRARLDRVVWVVSPDMAAATTRFLSGEADFIDVVRGPTVSQIASSPRLALAVSPGLDYGFLGFNMRRQRFADPVVRRAISAAIDRRAMVRNVFDTLALPGLGPVTRAQPSADPAADPAPYDSAAAARVLAARNLHFSILVPTSSAIRMQYATLLQAQLRKFGVTVTVEPLEVNAFARRLGQGDFDAVLNAWHTDPSPAAARQAWGAAALPPNGANFVAYRSARFDALLDSASRAFDPAAAVRLYRAAYGVIGADAPAVWLYEARSVSGVNRRVRMAGARPDAWWAGLPDWSVAAR